MKCIVTGGAGFIGSNLIEELIAQKHEVAVIDDLSTGSYKNIENMAGKINFIKGSVLNLDLLQSSFKDCDVIFHEAAIPSITRSIINPKATSEVNILGTLNVLLAARDNHIKKVVYASSSSVYGDSKELPKKETMVPKPNNPYPLSKLVGEEYCKQFHRLFGLGTVCLRYFNVFGPKQNPDSEYAAVIPKFIKLILNGKRPMIFGDGSQTRDFTFVKDVVKANILAAKSKISNGEVINIACQKNITINQLVLLINKHLGTDLEAEYANPRKGDIKDTLADISKARSLLGYSPNYDLEKGLIETIEWFKAGKI